MSSRESMKKYILIGISILIVMGLFIAYFMGKKQDKSFQEADALYSALVQHIQEEKYEEALILTEGLKEQQIKSEVLNYITAIVNANTGDFNQATKHMERTLYLNPHKVEDSMFMLQFVEMLLFAERMEDAAIVLEKCTTLPIPESYPQYMERIEQLQEQLNG